MSCDLAFKCKHVLVLKSSTGPDHIYINTETQNSFTYKEHSKEALQIEITASANYGVEYCMKVLGIPQDLIEVISR